MKHSRRRFWFLFSILLISLVFCCGCAGNKGNAFSSWSAFGNSSSQMFNKTWGLKY